MINIAPRLKIERLGEEKLSKSGKRMKIIEYNCEYIIVEFEDGYKTKSEYKHFKSGGISNPYDKTECNIGFIGEGNYTSKYNNKATPEYRCWQSMIRRCYSDNVHKTQDTYKNCKVCDEWLNFQVFADWYKNNYYGIDNEKMHLDKDILVKGNKVYSPETCVFVPERINTLFCKCNASRGDYPIGVCYCERNNKFRSYCNIYINNKTKQKFLGYYNSSEDAFYNGYKPFKEDYIKRLANEYKDRIPINLYEALFIYEVEITD